MLKEGIYEQLITATLKEKIAALSAEKFYVAKAQIDKERELGN